MSNKIPKTYVDYDLYANLVNNEDEDNEYYEMNPRVNSFEVSYKNYLIFSKLGGKYWPSVALVAQKVASVILHEGHGCDMSFFLAGMAPKRDGSYAPSKLVKKVPPRPVSGLSKEVNAYMHPEQ